MAEKLNSTITDYEKNFNSHQYVLDYTLRTNETIQNTDFLSSLAQMYHEIFSTHAPETYLSTLQSTVHASGARLLDVGSGPTLWHVMSASGKYPDITLSDLLPGNRYIQQEYIDDVNQDSRWTEHFRLTAKMEGDVAKWTEVRDRLRASVRKVVWCDVLQDMPLGSVLPHHEQYDCVMSSLCLEGACNSVPSYIKAVKNLVSLAKPGATIVLGGVLEEHSYTFGGSTFACLPLNKDIICKSLEAAQCGVRMFLSGPMPGAGGSDGSADKHGLYVVEARKL